MTAQCSQKVLNALSMIESKFGASTLPTIEEYMVGALDTGSMCLNAAIGIGGFPRGSIAEIYGEPDSGKTTALLVAVAKTQSNGELCAWIDAEKSFDPVYAQSLGVILEQLIMINPKTGEDGLEIVRLLAETDGISLIVVDSVAALVPKMDLDVAIGDTMAGLQARMMSSATKQLIDVIHSNKIVVAFTNQTRTKLPQFDGDKATTQSVGGQALKHYARVRIEMKAFEPILNGKQQVGSICVAKVIRNKVGNKGKVAPYYFDETRYNQFDDMLDLGLLCGAITKQLQKVDDPKEDEPDSVECFVLGGNSLGTSRKQARDCLQNFQQARDFLLSEFKRLNVVFKPAETNSKQAQALPAPTN